MGGSDLGGRGADGQSGFQHSDRNLYSLYIKAGMLRDSLERDRISTGDHPFALDGGNLTGGHLKDLRNMNYFPFFNMKVTK